MVNHNAAVTAMNGAAANRNSEAQAEQLRLQRNECSLEYVPLCGKVCLKDEEINRTPVSLHSELAEYQTVNLCTGEVTAYREQLEPTFLAILVVATLAGSVATSMIYFLTKQDKLTYGQHTF